MRKTIVVALVAFLAFTACNQNPSNNFENVDTLVSAVNFNKEINGKKVALFTLQNEGGITVKITNYGARLVSILMPDRNGRYEDIVPGYASIDEYIADNSYYGPVVGRFANRIARGKFIIDGTEYKLAQNNGQNALHGGIKGLHHVIWDAVQEGNVLSLSYLSPDMEEGYPGNLLISLKYILTANNELVMEYEAETDKKTVINLSSHAYYNLAGEGNGDILGHELEIFANQTTAIDSELIPTGVLAEVAGTPFDFTTPFVIGTRINDTNEQLRFGNGYDHNWALNKKTNELSLAVRLVEPNSGRVLEISTTEPGMQFYSGNFFDGSQIGKSGKAYTYRSALALEPQHFPDSPNHAHFPTTILTPSEKYKQTSVLKFFSK